VFNRNQGSVKAAKAGIVEVDATARQQDLNLTASAIAAWEKLAAAHKEAEAYQGDMVPSAERAYAQASDGYSAGRFSFLDLLDAQRTLYEVQEARLNSLLSLYEAKAQTDFLMNVYEPLIQNMIQGDAK
jgi:cobalt-zinc-cadmium efflux system outer membrane protein